jgi:hypothetical protein
MPTMMKRAAGAERRRFVVVHPLRDVPEDKLDTSKLGALPLGRNAKLALLALRGYLLLMTALVAYHAMGLAGFFRPFGH